MHTYPDVFSSCKPTDEGLGSANLDSSSPPMWPLRWPCGYTYCTYTAWLTGALWVSLVGFTAGYLFLLFI